MRKSSLAWGALSIVCLSLGAECRREQPPKPLPAAGGAAASPGVGTASPAAAGGAAAAGGSSDGVPQTLPESTPVAAPARLVDTGSGAVLVWASNQAASRKSELIARALDARGAFAGPPKLLRRTTGPVVDLDASARGESLWVGWIAVSEESPEEAAQAKQAQAAKNERKGKGKKRPRRMDKEEDFEGPEEGARKKYLIAALRTDPALRHAEPPVTIDNFRSRQTDTIQERVMVGATDKGGALVVAPGQPGKCDVQIGDTEDSKVPHPCDTFAEAVIEPDGKISYRGRQGRLEPHFFPHSVTPIPGGMVYASPAGEQERQDAILVGTADVPEAVTGIEYTRFGNFDLAWNGELLIAFDGTHIWPKRADGKAVAKLDKERDKEDPSGLPKLRSRSLRCVEGRPVLTLKWKGGQVELDPGRPGATRRLDGFLEKPSGAEEGAQLVWAGESLLGLNKGGQLKRWRCEGEAFKPLP